MTRIEDLPFASCQCVYDTALQALVISGGQGHKQVRVQGGRCTYEMMIAKAEWKVVGEVRAKLSLVISLGISTLLSEGHYSSPLAPRARPSRHNQGPLGLTKLDSSRKVGFCEGAELLSRPENCSTPVTLTTQETGLNNNSGTFTQADYATSLARRANAAPSFLIVYRNWLRLHEHMPRFWGALQCIKNHPTVRSSVRLTHQLFSSLR